MEQQTTTRFESDVLKKEDAILNELKKQEKNVVQLQKNVLMLIALGVFAVGAAIVGFAFLRVNNNRIYIEKSEIVAPAIDLAPQNSGTLQQLFVQSGDSVVANEPVARIGDELIKAQVAGTIIAVKNDIGKLFNKGESVVTMIQPTDLRVVGSLAEDKGLSDVRVGQRAIFTVDAFGSKQYEGIVDEISPTSRAGDVVFSISDKREEKEFNVKVRYDIGAYPELKNGMSAQIWVYKQ